MHSHTLQITYHRKFAWQLRFSFLTYLSYPISQRFCLLAASRLIGDSRGLWSRNNRHPDLLNRPKRFCAEGFQSQDAVDRVSAPQSVIQGPYYQPAILRPMANPCFHIFSFILITNLQIFGQGQGSLMTFAERNCQLAIKPSTLPHCPFLLLPVHGFCISSFESGASAGTFKRPHPGAVDGY